MTSDDDDWAQYEFCTCKHELGHHIHSKTQSKVMSFTVDPCTRCSCSFFQPADSNNAKLRDIVESLRHPNVRQSSLLVTKEQLETPNFSLVSREEVDRAIKTFIRFFGVGIEPKDSYDKCTKCNHYKLYHRGLSKTNLRHLPDHNPKKLVDAMIIKGTIEFSYEMVTAHCTECECKRFTIE